MTRNSIPAFISPTALRVASPAALAPSKNAVSSRHPPARIPRTPRAQSASASDSDHSLDSILETLRTRPTPRQVSHKPVVYLVGTGPGDPGLLTLRAVQLISTADVVLYDRLVSHSILSFVNPSATMVYVGKEAGFHTRSQEDIHLLLSHFAQSSAATVVRLKGGDPFVFGRGGEETDYLERLGIQVVAVPGITAAAGIAAMLALPLTMRGFSSSVRFLTGHLMSGVNVDFGPVDPHTTYVVYMGLAQLPAIAQNLMDQGLPQDTPAVAIERGTTPQQRVLPAELRDLPTLVEQAAFQSPTLIIVGAVVSLSNCWERRDSVLTHAELGMEPLPSFTSSQDPGLQQALRLLDMQQQTQLS